MRRDVGKCSVGVKKPRRQAARKGLLNYAAKLRAYVAELQHPDLGEDEAELVIAGGRRHEGAGQRKHVDAVLIGVGRIADVEAARLQGDDVAARAAVDEGEFAEGAVRLSGGEVVLVGDGRGLDHDSASGGAVGDQHLLGAVDQLAVDGGDAEVHGNGLEAPAVAQQREGTAVAGLEDLRGGLVRVGDGRGGGVGRSVVDARHREVDGGDLANLRVQAEGAPAPSQLVQHTVDVVVDGGRAEGRADGGVDDVSVDAVDAGVAVGDGAAKGADGGHLGGADVAGDQGDGAGARAGGDAKDLTLVEVVGAAGTGRKGDAVARSCGGRAGNGGGDDGRCQATGLQHGVETGCGAGGAGAGQLDAEGALHAGVGQQLLGGAEVGADEIAANHVTLHRSDFQVAHQDGVSTTGGAVRAVGGLGLRQNQALACKKGHRESPLSGEGQRPLDEGADACSRVQDVGATLAAVVLFKCKRRGLHIDRLGVSRGVRCRVAKQCRVE